MRRKAPFIKGQMTIREWEAALRREEEKNEIAIRYLDWALSLAKMFVHGDNDGRFCLEDLESECLYGLYKAIESYSPQHGCTFKTYASNVIRNQLYDFVKVSSRCPASEELTEVTAGEIPSVEDEVFRKELLNLLYAGSIKTNSSLALGYRFMIERMEGSTVKDFAKREGLAEKKVYRCTKLAEEDFRKILAKKGYLSA